MASSAGQKSREVSLRWSAWTRSCPAGVSPASTMSKQGELGEFFPLQPVQVAQGLLQPVAVPHGGDHGKDGDRALLGGGDQAGENEAVEPQQQRRAQ